MPQGAVTSNPAANYRETLRRKMLNYGLAASVLGLPIGILLGLPVVWGLAIAGIVFGGFKLWFRGNGDHHASPNCTVEDIRR